MGGRWARGTGTAAVAVLAVVASGLGTGVSAATAADRAGATFHVTSTDMCGGAGTLEQAVRDANANPGADTIVFDTPNMLVDVSTCFQRVPGFDYGLNATGSVDIQANGATFNGNLAWANLAGQINDPNMCPQSQGSNANWLQLSTGFMLIGAWGVDNTGVTVTVTDAHFNGLPSLVETTGGASFTMTDSTASKTIDFLSSCGRAAIAALDGGTITIVNSRIEHSVLPGRGDLSSLISTNSAAVVLDRVFLGDNLDGAAVRTMSGPVTILSSTLGATGGLWLAADSQIVNSAFFIDGQKPTDRIVTVGGTTAIEASTFYWMDPTCPTCDPAGPPGMGFRTAPSARFGLRTSAVGANLFSDAFGPPFSGPLLPPANISTDAMTWVQPTRNQDAAALALLVPNAKTNPPGLIDIANPYATYYVDAITPLLGTSGTPGVLIDAVPDATCPGGANALLDPVNGGCIAKDVLGNDRVDGNGKRNIGAVQVTYAPHLTVTGSGDGFVDLAWSRPKDPPSGTITGYDIGYRPRGSGGAFAHVYPSGAGTLAQQISGLTNGTEYEFVVRGVNSTGPGPDSNVVTATPLGPIATPVVATTPGIGQVSLSWPVPDSGGHPGPLSYYVVYMQVGAQAWTQGPGPLSSPTTVISGLTSGVPYVFGVFAVSTDGTPSAAGSATATPSAPPTPTTPGPLVFAPDPASFGTPVVGTPGTVTVTVTNTGTAPATPSALTPAGTGVTTTGGTCAVGTAIPAGGTCTVILAWTPAAAGDLSGGLLTVAYPGGAAASNSVALTGTGVLVPRAHIDYPNGIGQVGVPISPLTPHTYGLTEPIRYAVTAGTLPAGLRLDPDTGVISGAPTAVGTTTVTVTATGARGRTATTQVVITVSNEPVAPHLDYPAGIGQVGTALDPLTPHTAGLTGTLAYAVVDGRLPPGTTLDPATGVISGTPVRAGTYTATIEVTGANGTARAQVTITVHRSGIRARQRPARASYRPPHHLRVPGTTVVTPRGAVTNAGQRIRTRVTCVRIRSLLEMDASLVPSGDQTAACRVTRGPGTRVSVTVADPHVRVVVVQRAPATATYLRYHHRAVYVNGHRRT